MGQPKFNKKLRAMGLELRGNRRRENSPICQLCKRPIYDTYIKTVKYHKKCRRRSNVLRKLRKLEVKI